MRYTKTTQELYVYSIHGIYYFYGLGKLMHIRWGDSHVQYTLSHSYLGSGYLANHPLDDTGIGQLLNIEGKSEAELLTLIGMNR